MSGMGSDREIPREEEDRLLEAYALGQLTDAGRAQVEERFENSSEGRERLALVRREVETLRSLVAGSRPNAGDNTPSEETLAQYLDGTLEASSRDAVEAQLAASEQTLHQLITLYRETKAVLDPGVAVEMVAEHPAGETVSFEAGQARVEPGADETPIAEGEPGAEDEKRKQRYSSGRS